MEIYDLWEIGAQELINSSYLPISRSIIHKGQESKSQLMVSQSGVMTLAASSQSLRLPQIDRYASRPTLGQESNTMTNQQRSGPDSPGTFKELIEKLPIEDDFEVDLGKPEENEHSKQPAEDNRAVTPPTPDRFGIAGETHSRPMSGTLENERPENEFLYIENPVMNPETENDYPPIETVELIP